MPQINVSTFLSQTTWIIILFYIFYFTLKQYILPLVYEQIKIKSLSSNLVQSSNQSSNIVTESKNQWNNNLLKIIDK